MTIWQMRPVLWTKPKTYNPKNAASFMKLTPEEVEEESQIEKLRIAFLDAKLASYSQIQRLELNQWLSKFAEQSIQAFTDYLNESGILNVQVYPRVTPVILSSAEMRHHIGRVSSGVAWIDTATIGLLNHLALAPEEVVKSVACHEYLHVLYSQMNLNTAEPLAIRADIVNQYPEEQHAEEEWVRRMDHEFVGEFDYLEMWELAVEEFGVNWPQAYEKIKNSKKSR
jgi:hypothetical protein